MSEVVDPGSVLVIIPTYNEPAEVLLPTIAAAVALQPAHETWVLDDGNRPEVQALARQIQGTQSAEVTLMTRLLRERGAQPLPAPAASHGDMDGMQH